MLSGARADRRRRNRRHLRSQPLFQNCLIVSFNETENNSHSFVCGISHLAECYKRGFFVDHLYVDSGPLWKWAWRLDEAAKAAQVTSRRNNYPCRPYLCYYRRRLECVARHSSAFGLRLHGNFSHVSRVCQPIIHSKGRQQVVLTGCEMPSSIRLEPAAAKERGVRRKNHGQKLKIGYMVGGVS